ncbi:hypothetical protein [Martelella endophytica]|uniref:Uncharacterized protein n=1 Tax=Martelella endophytica TaxID=1486262 RepID=A0A0D5LKS2_MAREN|nr:hypothetical protein [Martelella endophytica]AJY44766.1 hypothetical protein TM49_02240 [Martelella endophytica]
MKIAGLVLVVIGFATWTIHVCLLERGDVAGTIQESLLVPLTHIVLVVGGTLLVLHLVYRVVRSVFHN